MDKIKHEVQEMRDTYQRYIKHRESHHEIVLPYAEWLEQRLALLIIRKQDFANDLKQLQSEYRI